MPKDSRPTEDLRRSVADVYAAELDYIVERRRGLGDKDVDASTLKLQITPTQDSLAILSGNADLWTGGAGLNQDLGISVSANGGADQLVAWKESGGFAGTYSPNAGFVQTLLPLQGGIPYTINLQWKTNKDARGSAATIVAGAGPWPPTTPTFSPTTLTAQLIGCG